MRITLAEQRRGGPERRRLLGRLVGRDSGPVARFRRDARVRMSVTDGAEAAFLTQCERSGSAQLCGCVLHALEKKYAYKEFSGFADQFARAGTLPQGAVEALNSCER